MKQYNPISLAELDAIVFDFGGVIINLDESKTYSQLATCMQLCEEELLRIFLESAEYKDYECGRITTEKFLHYLKSIANKAVSSAELVQVWNAMILDLPPQRVDLLKKLALQKRIFLLSNTNQMHEDYFTESIKKQGISTPLHDMFEAVWYSHRVGMRKPNEDIFLHVLQAANLEACRTLFIDDRAENTEAAARLGYNTITLTPDISIEQLFAPLL